MKLNDKEFEIFISAGEIADIVSRLAAFVDRDFAGKDPFFIIMLNGAFMFAADFLRKITVSHEVGFVSLSSYKGMQTSGQVKIYTAIPEKIKDRHVVILEDIVDTGVTMDFFLSELSKFSAKSVSIVSLFVKPDVLQQKIHVDYVGKEIENRFIVGYGLDYDGLGRNLEAVYVLTNK
jgi:hypoxanthine phosphoribosyltransferase